MLENVQLTNMTLSLYTYIIYSLNMWMIRNDGGREATSKPQIKRNKCAIEYDMINHCYSLETVYK